MARKFRSDVDGAVIGGSKAGPTHIHNPGRGGEIAAKALIVLFGLPIAWGIGLFLLGQAGVRKPAVVLANSVIWLPLTFLGLWLLSRFFENLLDRYYDHRERMVDKQLQRLRLEEKVSHSIAADTRRVGEEERFGHLIVNVMMIAYRELADDNTEYFSGTERPWSRRQAGAITLRELGESNPVGESMGARVRAWLEENGVIVNDQIDLDAFPNLRSIERLVYQPIALQLPPGYRPVEGGRSMIGPGE